MYYLLILRFLKGITIYLSGFFMCMKERDSVRVCVCAHMMVYVAGKAAMSVSTSVCLHILHFHLNVCVSVTMSSVPPSPPPPPFLSGVM